MVGGLKKKKRNWALVEYFFAFEMTVNWKQVDSTLLMTLSEFNLWDYSILSIC